MPLLLGIDAGNSKTLAVLSNEQGEVLGSGRAGCGNHQVFGMDAALTEIRAAIDRALQAAGRTPDEVDFAFYALCGADLDVDFAVLRPAVAALRFSREHALDNDMAAALRSGTDSPNAVVVVLGSGSNAAGRNDRGEQLRLPGLGWQSGDWGGAGDMVAEAVRQVARAWDGRGSRTRLEVLFTHAAGVPDVFGLIEAIHTGRLERAQLYALAPLIFEASDAGDPVARELVVRAGAEVAITALTLLRRLNLLDRRADVVLAGGLFRQENQVLLDIISDRMYDTAPDASLIISDVEPVVGAVLCAFDLTGLLADETVLGRLAVTSRQQLGGTPNLE